MASLHEFAKLESHLTCPRRTLSRHERKNYVDAVLCLRSVKPALYKDEFPGTNSRFDDFQALHINQSSIIHGNVYVSMAHKDQSIQLTYHQPGPISCMASMVHVGV